MARQYAPCLVVLLMSLPLATTYPDLFVDMAVSGVSDCTAHPIGPHSPHNQDPVTDATISVLLTSSQGNAQDLCPGATYQLQIDFLQARQALVSTSHGVLRSSLGSIDSFSCANRFVQGRLSAQQLRLNLTLPCAHQIPDLILVIEVTSATGETDRYRQASVTLPLSATCSAGACAPLQPPRPHPPPSMPLPPTTPPPKPPQPLQTLSPPPAPGCPPVSGYQAMADIEYPGSDMSCELGSSAGAQGEACSTDPACVAFNYVVGPNTVGLEEGFSCSKDSISSEAQPVPGMCFYSKTVVSPRPPRPPLRSPPPLPLPWPSPHPSPFPPPSHPAPPPSPSPPRPRSDRLHNSDTDCLVSPDCLTSASGQYTACITAQGLVTVQDQQVAAMTGVSVSPILWTSFLRTNVTAGGPWRLCMQLDGNLVAYDRAAAPVWSSRSFMLGVPPYVLTMEDNGNLVLRDGDDETTWETATGPMPCAQIEGYSVTYGIDYIGNDIECRRSGAMEEHSAACTANQACAAFNYLLNPGFDDDLRQGHSCLKLSVASEPQIFTGMCFYTKEECSRAELALRSDGSFGVRTVSCSPRLPGPQ